MIMRECVGAKPSVDKIPLQPPRTFRGQQIIRLYSWATATPTNRIYHLSEHLAPESGIHDG